MTQPSSGRPLSPHLSVYRWQITNTLSILHRISGFGLFLGLIPFTLWLWGAAYDPDLFECMSGLFHSIIGELCLFGWTLAFYYHFCNGIRHLNWDLGRGFESKAVSNSGRLAIVVSLGLTMVTWAYVAEQGVL